MKRLLTGALALSLLAGTAAVAQPDDHRDHRDDRGQVQARHDNRDFGRNGGNGRHWARGQRLPSAYYRDSSHYVDYRAYHLRRPPHGYRWVRTEDNNYALVAITTGLIASIIANSR
jgi:Ni/Co efflux regulator RcnB